MKVLLINGSPKKDGCTYTALMEIGSQLKKKGIDSEVFHIGGKPVGGCIACQWCHNNGGERCVFDDVANECRAKLKEADGVVVGSPVYYAGPNSSLTGMLDRVFYPGGSVFAHKPAAAIVNCRRGGASSSFDRLNKYFTIARMPVVSSQYWNSTHGFTPDQVRKDKEGLQIMRGIADNMAWMLKCIEAGKAAGITPPEPEAERHMTNFID